MHNLLHINSYYFTNKLHDELVHRLDSKNTWKQCVYVPVKHKIVAGNHESKDLVNTVFFFSKAFNTLTRIIWPIKIWQIYKNFQKIVNHSFRPHIIHSHSLIVNGTIAFIYNKKTNIPYIVTVRSADIKTFVSKSILFRILGENILNNASAVLLLSPAYRDIQLKKYISKKSYNNILNKTYMIPNGINDFWLNNKLNNKKLIKGSTVRMIFCGKLNRNKNLKTLMNACDWLNSKGIKVSLDVVGDGPLYSYLSNYNTITKIIFHGFVSDKRQLLSIYRKCHIVAVPSFRESFGLIYAEGMSQGLPVIYTRGQGFDGYFNDGEVGYSVNPKSMIDIADKIELIINNYDKLSYNTLKNVDIFSWSRSACKINAMYKGVINT